MIKNTIITIVIFTFTFTFFAFTPTHAEMIKERQSTMNNPIPETIPYIGLTTNYDNGDGIPVAMVGKKIYKTFSELKIAIPYISEIENGLVIAKALIHFDSRGHDFDIIDDPKQYKIDYENKYKKDEDKNLPFDPFTPALDNYSMPNLDQITMPQIVQDKIMFFATHLFYGTPYLIVGSTNGDEALIYKPL